MKNSNKSSWTFAVLLTAMLLVPAWPAWSDDARADRILLHSSILSDGKNERTVSFTQAGTDKTVALNIPNGADIVSARMNISSLPLVSGGDDYPDNVTVDVGNDGTIDWAFQGKGYGQMGRQTMFSDGAQTVNVGLPQNGGTNSSATVRLPKNAHVTSATLNASGGGNFLLIYADNDPTYVNDVLTKLRAFKNDLSVVDSFNAGTGTPSLALLKSYSGCMIYENSYTSITGYTSFQDRVALGDVLADYVDGGGGVVTTHFCWYSSTCIGGRFNSQGYFLVPTGGTTGWTTTGMAIQSILMPNHPIMNGVTDIHFVQGTLISSPAVTAGVNGGQIVFTWTLGSCAGALVKTMPNGVNRVDLYYIPWSDSVPYRSNYGAGYTGNGDVLMKNSLVWTGGAGSGNYSIDFGNDGNVDWSNPNMTKPETVPDFSSQLNSFLAKAQPAGTDAYGNEYVDVPIAVASNSSGRMRLANLSINYDLTSVIDINPTTGNLTNSLNALPPKSYDMRSSNVTVTLFSNHSGRLKISNVRIEFFLMHPSIIQSRTPEDFLVYMNENSTQEFIVTTWDPYDFPMCVTWLVMGKAVLKGYSNMTWYADFDANGSYNVTAQVDNGEQKASTSWKLTVRNVNRNPIIDSFSPEKRFEMDENSSATFEVLASDPDNNAISHTWYLDGKRVLSEETIYEYKTTYSSAGKHEVKVTVLDALGASTTLAWDITVKEVNAGPQIADSSPQGDTVTMPENSAKKFSVVDISPDLDKQSITWSLDGNNTGMTGRSYNYSADFESAGTHVVQAEISDGKLSEKRVWTVTVTDVNRVPLAVIASPAAKAEFMLGADITFDGSTSSDPDGDQLTMSWSEAGKPLGTGSSLTTKLAKGKHIITLGVDDGKKNGIASAQVEIYVRYLDFKGTVTIDLVTPTEGQKLVVSARLTNRGDGSVDELAVSFSVDGTEVTTTVIETIEPDAEYPLEFQWKAVKGDHKLEVTVNNQNFSKTVTVAKKPTTSAPVGGDMMPLIAVAVIAVVALVAVAAVMARRKGGAAAIPRDEGRVAARPAAPMAYKPIQKARVGPPVTKARPPPIPPARAARGAAPPAQAAPAMAGEEKAREAIENLEGIIKDAEAAGLDTTKARQSLKVARNFMEMGKYDKALLHCQNAENSIE